MEHSLIFCLAMLVVFLADHGTEEKNDNSTCK